MAETSKQNSLLNATKVNKKPKNEKIHAAVDNYLKQKCYVTKDKPRRSDLVLQHNTKQFVFQKMLETDTRDINSFTYSNVICLSNNNHHLVDQQFGRFTQFVESQQDAAIRFELRRFYAPILCHLYIELLKARETKSGAVLLRKYAHLVAPREVYEYKIKGAQKHTDKKFITNGVPDAKAPGKRENLLEDHEADYFHKLLQTLAASDSLEAIDRCRSAARFRSSKYELHTTQAAMDALMNFLEKRGHVLLLQIINTWLHVHIFEHDVGEWTEDHVFGGRQTDDSVVQPIKETTVVSTAERPPAKRSVESSLPPDLLHDAQVAGTALSDQEYRYRLRHQNVRNALRTMRDTRGALLKNQIEFPHYFKIADKDRGVTSAHLCLNECHLAAGFNNSAVGLWPLNQQTRSGKQLYRKPDDISCPWDINNCKTWKGQRMGSDAEEDDDIECDIKEHARTESAEERRKKEKFYEKKYEDNSFGDYGSIMLRGHTQGVTDVRFSAHYPLLYTTSKDHTWRSWRADNYNCSLIYRGHRYPIWCIDESPAGQYVATGSHDLTARLWSLERDYPLITYVGHNQDIECVAFHPNANYLATGSADLTVRLWCVSSGRLVRVFHNCKQPVAAITFSPDGKFLAAGGDESKVRIYDLAAGAQLVELKDHKASVTSIAWSSCGRELASVCSDGTLRLWDVKKVTPLVSGENDEFQPNTSSTHRLMTTNSSTCQKLLRVLYSRSETICCFGV